MPGNYYDPEWDGFAYSFDPTNSYADCVGCGIPCQRENLTEGLCCYCNSLVLREVEYKLQTEFDVWATQTNEGRFAVAYAAHERENGGA